jgi:hypothetical protein
MITQLVLLAVVLITATISGVFGMAGGLMLMGALTLVMPVSAAMVAHGAVQFVSNGWRAVLHREAHRLAIIIFYGVGSAIAAGLLALVTYEPTKAWVYLMLGLVPGLAWLPKGRFNLDAAKPTHATACGLSSPDSMCSPACPAAARCVFRAHRADTPRDRRHQSRDASVQPHGEDGVLRRAAVGRFANKRPAALVFLRRRRAPRHARRLPRRQSAGPMSDVNFLKWTRWIVTAGCVLYLAQAAVLICNAS